VRRGPEEERAFRSYTELERTVGYVEEVPAWIEPVQNYGLSGGQMLDLRDMLAHVRPEAEAALARGDIRLSLSSGSKRTSKRCSLLD
jgi:hypothetical protein